MTTVSWQQSELTSSIQDDIYAFRKAQDDIYAFRKAHICFTPLSEVVPNVAFKTVPMLI